MLQELWFFGKNTDFPYFGKKLSKRLEETDRSLLLCCLMPEAWGISRLLSRGKYNDRKVKSITPAGKLALTMSGYLVFIYHMTVICQPSALYIKNHTYTVVFPVRGFCHPRRLSSSALLIKPLNGVARHLKVKYSHFRLFATQKHRLKPY